MPSGVEHTMDDNGNFVAMPPDRRLDALGR
jgi:hypothetical protein